MTSYNMYSRTVRDCFASALDVQDGGFTVPSTRAEIAKSLATKVMAAVSSEKMHCCGGYMMLWRLLHLLLRSHAERRGCGVSFTQSGPQS